jgi:hypothetical protein
MKTKRLVIDSDVAQSAGTKEDPISQSCREVLEAVRDICHKVVLTEDIFAEWKRHRSNFTATWLRSMRARRKQIVLKDVTNADLRARIDALSLDEQTLDIMKKDVHLVEAALETDHIIISRDETARELFREASEGIGALKRIVWINPTHEDEHVKDWLGKGAKLERSRQFRGKS